MIPKRLEPITKNPSSSFWVDEAIWGHRLYDEQTPWFIFLEFLNVAASARKEGRLFDESRGHNRFDYVPAQRLYLRNLLFNFPLARLQEIDKVNSTDDRKWNEWEEAMEYSQVGLINPDFGYLRHRFSSFSDFVEIIRLVHSSCLELRSNKRWTSKFVFPYCEEALYEDLSRDAKDNDRRFFGRTGELLYLMLSRAKGAAELKDALERTVFGNQNSMWRSILRALQPSEGAPGKKRPGGFLPYAECSCFDILCEDWLAILRLNMPVAEMIPHLVCVAGFHIMRYQQVAAHQNIADIHCSYFVSEIIAPRKTLVRELSVEHYQMNNTLSTKAVIQYVEDIKSSSDWQDCLDSPDPFQACRDLLLDKVLWPRKESDYEGARNPEALMAAFLAAVKRRHGQHVANIHRVYGREVGLVSKRGTNRLRYAPTDSFLRSFALANVVKRMELKEFLQRLFERYDIVIGDVEAERMSHVNPEDLDRKAFQSNAERLEQRLSSIGLLRRLSDGCAYVVNQYE